MKRLLTLLTAAALMLGLTACGAATQTQEAETGSGAAETRIVTDVWNREVEIPAQVESIVCLGSMAPRFAAYLDVVDMMVGAEDMLRTAVRRCSPSSMRARRIRSSAPQTCPRKTSLPSTPVPSPSTAATAFPLPM